EMVGNWLHGVAYCTALEARTARARRRAAEQRVTPMPQHTEPEAAAEPRELLDEELGRLPEKYRVAVVLCELEGRGRAEGAAQLGIPGGTLSSRLATARKLLAGRLSRRGLVLSAAGLAALLADETASAAVPAALASSTTK